HARHLRALGAGTDHHLELGAGRHRVEARRMQGVDMEEGVALAIGQFDEAVALVGLEPFDDGVDRRPGRRRRRHRLRPAKAAALETARGARPRIVGHRPVIVEPALSRSPEILTLAHVAPVAPTNYAFWLRLPLPDRPNRNTARR